MDPQTQGVVHAAEEAVARLVEASRNPGPLYVRSPREVAQVSRTAKWLLNATAALSRALAPPPAGPAKQRRRRAARA
jgi:hypothetical protein